MAVRGVDLSEMNGSVDFQALKAAGVGFVLLRCGYGSDFPGQQDTEFEANIRKAEAAGIPWGAYHFAYARDVEGGKREAAHALRLLRNRKPAYGIWYDMEADSTLGGDLAGAADAFCSEMEARGLYAGVYASLNWFENYLTSPVFDKYDRWCAQYNRECELNKPYGIWQFTDKLVIGGKEFDGDWAYKDYPSLTKGGNRVNKKSRVFSEQENAVTQGFGNGHGGVDLGWQKDPETPVTAHSEGTVVFVQTGCGHDLGARGNASYGNCVKLKHPNGYFTLYAHLSAVKVSYGQQVKKGQQIGRMGNTGNSYGNHLHFEVRNTNDDRIDPAPYLAEDLPGLETEKEEADLTEAEARKIAQNEIEKYFAGLAGKPAPGWAKEALDFAREEKILNGDEDGRLRPESYVKRDELAQVEYNRERRYKEIEDVPNWAKAVVQELIDLGVILGTEAIKDGKVTLNMSEAQLRSLVFMKRYVDARLGEQTTTEE